MSLIPLFQISSQQDERRKTWCREHADKYHPKGVRDCSGAAWKYTIIPNGVGDNITIECIWCLDKKVILTEGDDGEFLYDLDGKKTWCGNYANPSPFKYDQSHCGNAELHMEKCALTGKHLIQVDLDGDCKFCCHH